MLSHFSVTWLSHWVRRRKITALDINELSRANQTDWTAQPNSAKSKIFQLPSPSHSNRLTELKMPFNLISEQEIGLLIFVIVQGHYIVSKMHCVTLYHCENKAFMCYKMAPGAFANKRNFGKLPIFIENIKCSGSQRNKLTLQCVYG